MLSMMLNQASVKAWHVRLSVCLMVACVFVPWQWPFNALAASEHTPTVIDVRYGPRVEFQTEARTFTHRVWRLDSYAVEHPDEAELLADIRDTNARWLLMQAREYGKFAVSYDFELDIVGKPPRHYPYTGPYDRGVRFRPPSEWILYYVNPVALTFSEIDEGLILISYTSSEPEPPPFAREVALWPSSRPEIWRQRASYTLWPSRSPNMLACELLIDPDTYFLLSERLTTSYWRYWHNAEYSYREGEYPKEVRVTLGARDPNGASSSMIEAKCGMVDSFWFIRAYTRYRDNSAQEISWTVSVNDITVTKM